MNELLDKFNDYCTVLNYTMEYTLQNGDTIEYKISKNNFPHLIGLHKLTDIPIIQQFNDKNNKMVTGGFLVKKIKKELLLTESIIKGSRFFVDIQDRYNQLSSQNLLSTVYTDIVIDFDATKIPSKLNAEYIFYDKISSGYNHLCIAKDSNLQHYTESFFFNSSDVYIKNQQVLKVKELNIIDNKGDLYITLPAE